MNYNIGLNIIETDGTASPSIVGAATSTGAFTILTARGVANTPTPVSSFASFVKQFGSYIAGGLGAYLIKGFFDNGGTTAYINRVISNDAATGHAAASVTLSDAGNKKTLELQAGFRSKTDPGAWGNQLFVTLAASASAKVRLAETKAASVTGSALTATVDMTALPPLSVTIDGQAQPASLSFKASDFPGGPASATPAQIRDAINRQTTALIASLDSANEIILTSSGSIAKLSNGFTSIAVPTANATLGFAAPAAAVTGTPAAISETGTQFETLAPFAVGDAVQLSDGTQTTVVKLVSLNQTNNTATWAPNVADIATYDAHKLRASEATLDLTINLGGTDSASQVETWTGLSMEHDSAAYVITRLNDPISGSKFVVATNLAQPAGGGPEDLPVATSGFTALANGRDGTPTANDFIGDPAAHTGFYAFDPFDVQLLACERTDPSILTAALAYCAGRGDCMYIGSVPQGYVAAGQAATYGKSFQAAKSYGALYGPWIAVTDPAGTGANPQKWLPPVGHIMGVYARTDVTRGIWKAPAGDAANLLGALDVEYRLSDTEHTALVKTGSVNGVRVAPGAGIVVDASRTLSTDTRWLYVNVRLLFNYVKSSLRTGLRWVRQEPNRNSLWDAIRIQTVNPFLTGLWRQGAFGTGTAAQTFTVTCDATNNPPDQVDQGNLTVEIYFYPSRPAETIVVIVGQQPSGATVSES